MRLEIKTIIRNPFDDLKCLIVMDHALRNIGTPRMIKANLEYIADKFGFSLVPKIKK